MVNYQISVWIPIYMLWMWTQTCTYPEQVRNKQWIIATLEKRYSMRKFVHLCVYQCRPCYPSGTKALKIYRLTQLFWLCCVCVNMSNHARICVFWSLWSAWIRQTPSLVRVGETGLWLVWWHFLRMLYVAGKRSTGQTAFVVESSQHETHVPKCHAVSCGLLMAHLHFVPDKL